MSSFYTTKVSLLRKKAVIFYYAEISTSSCGVERQSEEYIVYYPDEGYFQAQMKVELAKYSEIDHLFCTMGFEDIHELTIHLFSEDERYYRTAKKTIEKLENYIILQTEPINY